MALPLYDIGAWEQNPLAHLQTGETLTLQILSSTSLFLHCKKNPQRSDLQGLSCDIVDINSLMSPPASLVLAPGSHTLYICHYSVLMSSNIDNLSYLPQLDRNS